MTDDVNNSELYPQHTSTGMALHQVLLHNLFLQNDIMRTHIVTYPLNLNIASGVKKRLSFLGAGFMEL